MMTGYERTQVKVDLDAVMENMNMMRSHIGSDVKIMGVIKTDGYGHGAIPIAHMLEELDYVYGFATATTEEAVILRKAGIKKPLLILGYTFPSAYEKLAELDLRPAVFKEDMVLAMEEAAKKAGKNIKVHIKVDTGMSRIGIRPDEEGFRFVQKLLTLEHIETEGIFTHFARADEADKRMTLEQLQEFQKFISRIETELHYSIPVKHCSNSAGILGFAEANMDLVRAGIILYGLWPSDEMRKDTLTLKPALSWESTVVYIKKVTAGTPISYGGTFVAASDRIIATIPVGYGDGYPRSLSNKGCVLIAGKRAPIVGRICMDQFMVDVTDIPGAEEGSQVILIGKDGGETLDAEYLGELSGRFNYELVCDIGKRVPRIYYRNGKVTAVKTDGSD